MNILCYVYNFDIKLMINKKLYNQLILHKLTLNVYIQYSILGQLLCILNHVYITLYSSLSRQCVKTQLKSTLTYIFHF